MAAKKEFQYIPVHEIDISDSNVRKDNVEEGLDELAQSIQAYGVLQPVVVYRNKEKQRYELVIGQRRLLACRDKLGLKEIPARILDVKDETQVAILSFSENIHRLDLEYRDKMAVATRLLADLGSVKEVAAALGVKEQTVRNYLGYAGVPERLKELVDGGKITATTALNIARKIPDEARAVEIAKKVTEQPSGDKRTLLVDLARENPSKSAAQVSQLVMKARFKNITIHLTSRVAEALEGACKRYESEPEDVARNALEDWLERERLLT